MSTVEQNEKSRSPLGEQGPGNVDKIRDILFGAQMRDYELRFSRVEESLRKEAADLKETTRKRFDSLEAWIRKELESLEVRLKSERDDRTGADRQIAADLKSTHETLSRKAGEVEEQNLQSQRELRNNLMQQSKDLSEEIRAKTDELAALIDRRVQELRHDKTDRAALASMLTEVAMRLNDEFQVPGAE